MDVIKKKHWWQSDQLKWSVIGLLGLLVGYLVVLMYVQGEYLFAIMTLILSSAGLYILQIVKPTPGATFTRPRRHGAVCAIPAGVHHRYRLY